ncbi:MAG: DegV family protein [Clostridia bacterium]|nr:DegV family protein [Clostridia bacterium]
MLDYQIIADSSCEMSDDLREAARGKNVPLILRIGEKEFIDDENLDIADYLRQVDESKERITSACPSPDAFAQAFKNSEAENVFSITLSSRLSGSYSSAVMGAQIAEEESDKKVHIFDSKSASAGEMLIAIKIREFVEKGLDRAEIIEKVENFIKEMKTHFVLETTDYLVKNGRIPSLLGKAVTLLNIKFVLGDDGDGKIKIFSKAKGFNAAIKRMIEVIGEQSKNLHERTLVITHCENEAAAQYVAKAVKELYNFKEIIISKTSGLSSMYAGRGGVILAF